MVVAAVASPPHLLKNFSLGLSVPLDAAVSTLVLPLLGTYSFMRLAAGLQNARSDLQIGLTHTGFQLVSETTPPSW